MEPDGDVNAWLGVIGDACKLALDAAQTEDDVMQIFKKNKQLFDAVKTQDALFFKDLMSQFTQAKSRFTQEAQ
jgi:hypothetical protein